MHEDRSVTTAFIYVLRLEFVKRGRGSVTLDVIDEQVTALLTEVPRTTVRTATQALVQRLATSQASVFRCEQGRLLLTKLAISEPSAVKGALQGFDNDLRRGESAAAQTTPAVGATRPAPRKEPVASSERSEALDDFFEGFEQEILRARLGEDGSRDRG